MRGSVDVNEYGITGTEYVSVWRGNVHVRLEGELFFVEDVAAKDFFPVSPFVLVFFPQVFLDDLAVIRIHGVEHELVQLVLHVYLFFVYIAGIPIGVGDAALALLFVFQLTAGIVLVFLVHAVVVPHSGVVAHIVIV